MEREDVIIELVSTDGRTIFSEYLTNYSGSQKKIFDLSIITKGIYILKIISGSVVMTKKIIHN